MINAVRHYRIEATSLPYIHGHRVTLPSGEALLLTTDYNRPQQPPTLELVDLAGDRELLYPTDNLGRPFNGNSLCTPDGTQLVLGSDAGLVVMGNDGTVVRTVSIGRGPL